MLDSLQMVANKMLSAQQILLTCWNGEDIFEGSHTIAVSKSGSTYTSYNRYGTGKTYTHTSLVILYMARLLWVT
ncbi:MAG: hypothetical protein LBE09_07415 [Christensenellaceae bacterium]|nr:hypothetical protein [Christensenellaceae bacterium]